MSLPTGPSKSGWLCLWRGGTLILAKFIVVLLWSVCLTILIYLVALLAGASLGLAQATPDVIMQGSVAIGVTAALVIAVMTPVALLAGIGRGYLLPIGITIVFVLFANVLAVAGWGEYFPWAVPALYAGAGDAPAATLPLISYWIVLFTALAGLAGTYVWWQFADQSR